MELDGPLSALAIDLPGTWFVVPRNVEPPSDSDLSPDAARALATVKGLATADVSFTALGRIGPETAHAGAAISIGAAVGDWNEAAARAADEHGKNPAQWSSPEVSHVVFPALGECFKVMRRGVVEGTSVATAEYFFGEDGATSSAVIACTLAGDWQDYEYVLDDLVGAIGPA